MNRRTFTKTATVGTFALLATVGLTTPSLAQTPQASPVATPEGPVKWVSLTRDYADAFDGVDKLYVWLGYSSHRSEIPFLLNQSKEEALEADSEIYLTKDVKDAPKFGDDSWVVTGKLNAGRYIAMFGVSKGNLVYYLAFKDESTEAALELGYELLREFVDRIEVKSSYSDEELFDLLPTEEETGLVIFDESYDAGEYDL